ncbi:MAG: aldolase [Actinomycetota bacterium]|nr:aldolase [Actinomycetota bacterium]
MSDVITDERWAALLDTRASDPHAIRVAYQRRERPRSLLSGNGTLFLVAADHPARGALGVGANPLAMADRRDLLRRLMIALADPRVDGLLATPDIVEDLLLLGGLEGKVVIGSMNRGGLAGASWEIDDRFTAYDAESIAEFGLDGGKLLLRLVDSDRGTASTLAASAAAVTALARRELPVFVEPLPYEWDDTGRLVLRRDDTSLARAITVAAGLGVTSAWTWLKLPAPTPGSSVLDSTTMPVVVLGGMPSGDLDADMAAWGAACAHPAVRGLVVGRALLYPPGDDVAAAVAAAADILAMSRKGRTAP